MMQPFLLQLFIFFPIWFSVNNGNHQSHKSEQLLGDHSKENDTIAVIPTILLMERFHFCAFQKVLPGVC